MKHKLTPLKIRSLNKAGDFADGNGLYLKVTPSQTKSWFFRYQLNGKRTKMGLGSINDYSLKDARKKAEECRKILLEGKDPRAIKNAQLQQNQINQVWTFDKCAEAYIDAHSPSWKNDKHIQQWRNTIAQYASPVFGKLPVEEITTSLIMQVIEPIWLTKTETASRLRGRIERILSWAIVRGYRPSPNPALWRGNISELLPQANKVKKVRHHPAMHYDDMPEFMVQLRNCKSTNARALEFTILTCLRTDEVIGSSWNEVDFKSKTISLSADRMKSKKSHRVPLSKQTVSLLNNLYQENNWLFPSVHHGKHLSNMAMLKLLQGQLQHPELTVHGFRSTFRDWVAEKTTFQRELAECALAHVLADKTEAAYQRGDMLEKRRILMQAWADYIYGEVNNVLE